MSEAWSRRILYIAGAWNTLGGLGALVNPQSHFARLYDSALSMNDPVQAFFFRATWINVIAWGVAYVLAARHPTARLPVLLAGGVGKLAYFAACVLLFRSGSGSTLLLTAGLVDVLFATAFSYILISRRQPTRIGFE